VKVKVCDVNADAENKLPAKTEDKSGIGVHYIDAYIKPMNTKLEDGTAVRCKRRGLKITLSAGTNIIGACCGSTPDHIRAFRKVIDEFLEAKGIESPKESTSWSAT